MGAAVVEMAADPFYLSGDRRRFGRHGIVEVAVAFGGFFGVGAAADVEPVGC